MRIDPTTNPQPKSDPPRALVTLEHVSDRRSVEAALQRVGYAVHCSTDDHTVDVLLHSFTPDILILDSRQAYPQSSPMLSQIRRCPDIHTLVIGADSDDQRIAVLRSGVDDVVATDTSPDEVAMRCHAILRRLRQAQVANDGGRVLYFGPMDIDLGRREIRVDQMPIPATRLEFELFAELCRRPLEVCSRSQLLHSIWGPHWVGDTHVVDVHLSNLRRKFSDRNPKIQFMQTVRGVGFRLADDILNLASKDLASRRYLDTRSPWLAGASESS